MPLEERIMSNDLSGEHREALDVGLNQRHVRAFARCETAGMGKLLGGEVDGGDARSPLG